MLSLVLGAMVAGADRPAASRGQPQAPGAGRAALALLVGIDRYAAPEVPPLAGAVNDVRLMREVLIGKFGFSPDNILILENEQATHAGIVGAIQSHLIAKARPGDVAVLHFSGHGSQMEDASGDEIDRLDETLVAHDSRMRGVFDIADDEINELLLALTGRTERVTFIFDSCHSGSASRGGNTIRMIPRDARPAPQAPTRTGLTRGAGEGDADLRPAGSAYVLISGSLAKELSNEADFEGRPHGALTWHLAEALKSNTGRLTYRDVMDDVRSAVHARFPTQTPQIEGPGQDVRVFGVDQVLVKPYVLANPRGQRSAVLEAGRVFGLTPGALVQAYAPRTVDFDSAKAIARLKVSSVEDFQARAEIVEGGPLAPRSRAVLEAAAYGERRIPVFVDEAGSPALRAVSGELAKLAAVSITGTPDGARLLVRRERGQLRVESGDLALLVPPVPESEAGALQHVVAQVRDLLQWMSVVDLTNPNSALRLQFSLRSVDESESAPAPTEVGTGAELGYVVQNDSEKPLYIYVLDASSDGSIAVLYPRREQQHLPAGGRLERRLRMSVPEGRESVTDTVKVIATVVPIDTSVFPQGAIRSAGLARSGATRDPLAAFLAAALRGTRQGEDITVASDGWATAQKSIRIRAASLLSPGDR
jgi:hypothetical protein